SACRSRSSPPLSFCSTARPGPSTLSLHDALPISFATAWIGENHLAALPVALYGGLLIMAAVAYTILMMALIRHEGPDSPLARARSEEHTSELQSPYDLVCRLLLEKKKHDHTADAQ